MAFAWRVHGVCMACACAVHVLFMCMCMWCACGVHTECYQGAPCEWRGREARAAAEVEHERRARHRLGMQARQLEAAQAERLLRRLELLGVALHSPLVVVPVHARRIGGFAGAAAPRDHSAPEGSHARMRAVGM